LQERIGGKIHVPTKGIILKDISGQCWCEWKVTCPAGKSTCPRCPDSPFFNPCLGYCLFLKACRFLQASLAENCSLIRTDTFIFIPTEKHITMWVSILQRLSHSLLCEDSYSFLRKSLEKGGIWQASEVRREWPCTYNIMDCHG